MSSSCFDFSDDVSLSEASTLSQTFARAQTSLDDFMAKVNDNDDDNAPGALRLDDDISSVWSEDVSHAEDLQRHLSQAENDFQMQFAYVMAELNLAAALNKGAPHKAARKVGMNSHLVEQYMKSLSSSSNATTTSPRDYQQHQHQQQRFQQQQQEQQQRRQKSSLMQQRIQAFEAPRNNAQPPPRYQRGVDQDSTEQPLPRSYSNKSNSYGSIRTLQSFEDGSESALLGLQGIGMLEEI